MTCVHNKRIGDNYGISCQECGRVIEGYGYGGFFGRNLQGNERCTHGSSAWYKISDAEEECIYCHVLQDRRKKVN